MFQKLVSSSEGVRAEGITEGQQRGMHCCLPENQERPTFNNCFRDGVRPPRHRGPELLLDEQLGGTENTPPDGLMRSALAPA